VINHDEASEPVGPAVAINPGDLFEALTPIPRYGWIGVDLDGTLAKHPRGPFEPTEIGAPIPRMVERVQLAITRGYTVKIVTARMCEQDDDTRRAVQQAIGDWTGEHIGQRLIAVFYKDYSMLELWDDRAVQVICDTGEFVGQSALGID
jgi:hypothetical protein